MTELTIPTQPREMLGMVSTSIRALEKATDPAEVLNIERTLEAIEHAMRSTGLYKSEQVREANEGKVRARHKLGQLLAKFLRGTGPGRGKKMSVPQTSFRAYLKQLELDKSVAADAQRIGAMPDAKLEKVLAQYRGTEEFMTFRELIIHARPHWHQEKRVQNHERIIRQAAKVKLPDRMTPFPLMYWDPPTQFDVHTPDMTHRMPDDHYPTLTDDEIINIKFNGQSISDLAHKDCSTFMWCTSANLKRSINILEMVGFEYKTHAVWDKGKIGLGYIFRNQHEVLLYGTRGSPPMPVELFSSVFRGPKFKRARHSEKPDEVRKILERMYPHYTAENRVELFARGEVKGWTVLGYEAAN